MRLTLKLALGLVLTIFPVIAVNSGIRVRREISAVSADARADDLLLARTVASATAAVWRTSGEDEARLLVASAQQSPHVETIRWTWLDASPGDPEAPTAAADALANLVDGSPIVVDAPSSTLTYVPVSVPGGRRGAIEIARPDAPEDVFVRHTIRQAAVATGAVLGLCGCLALGLGMIFVGRPVRLLAAQTRRIGAGDLASRLHLTQRDELGYIAAEINSMSEQLRVSRDRLAAETAAKVNALQQVRRADRLATVGKLAAGIAHELGTPLNVISGHAQLIAADHQAGSAEHENATIIVEQTLRVATIIRQLLDFARRGTPDRTSTLLAALVTQTVQLLRPLADARGVSLELDILDPDVRCRVDTGQLQQALTNLVINALQAVRDDRTVSVRLSTGEHARIDVEDRGTGIAADVLPRIFEPFFTTKSVGDGTGLGLSVTYGIVRDHDGWIDVESHVGFGSRFSIVLPIDAIDEVTPTKGPAS